MPDRRKKYVTNMMHSASAKKAKGYSLVVVKVGNMRAISKVSQVPNPQNTLVIATRQDVAGHAVPGDHIHICVGRIHAEHAAAALPRVPDPQAVVNGTGCKHICLSWAPLQILHRACVALI